MNPLYAARRYSTSVAINSRLDDYMGQQAWIASVAGNVQWMEIDAGEPMYISGVMTQGRWATMNTNWDYAFAFVVTAGLTANPSTVIAGSSPVKSDVVIKTQYTFDAPVWARFIRIQPTSTSSSTSSMRAALLVYQCKTCFTGSSSSTGSVSPDACTCTSSDSSKHASRFTSPADMRALHLDVSTGQLARLNMPDLRYFANTGVIVQNAGPSPGFGPVVTFDRSLNQAMDGGAQNFMVRSTSGFTAIAVFMFAGTAGTWERIFQFGNSAQSAAIYLRRQTTGFMFIMNNAGMTFCSTSVPTTVLQNVWSTFVVTYNSADFKIVVSINGRNTNGACSNAATNFVLPNTYIAKHSRNMVGDGEHNTTGRISGFYAVDELLSASAINQIITRMNASVDVVQPRCVLCSFNEIMDIAGVCQLCPAFSVINILRTACDCRT